MSTENLPISGLYPLPGVLTPNDLLVISQELPEGWQSFNVQLSKFVDLVVASMNESAIFMRKVYTIDDDGLVGAGILTDALGLNWDYLRTQFAPFNVGDDYVTLTTRIIAGNGLTGGGDLTANRSIVLGTPSSITAVTTNSVSAESHTHAIDKATTEVAGVVKLVDTVTSSSLTDAPTARVAKVLNDTKTDKTTTVTAGNGLTGGGDLSANRTITLGNPSTLSETSTNNVTATSHTHAVEKASTVAAGLVKLNDTLVSTSTTEAPTAKVAKTLNDIKADKSTTLAAGNGLTGGGDLSLNRTISMGVPSTITESSVNGTGAGTHSHAVDKASTSIAGVVKLNDSLVSTSITEAATANAVKTLNDSKANKAVSFEVGWGLTGGGNLETNRTIDLNLAQLDTRYAAAGVGSSYVPLTRVVTAGTGLTGGGDLSTNRSFAVNFGTAANTVAMGNDNRILNGQTAFSWGNHTAQNYLRNITLKANSGLLGDGTAANGLELNYSALDGRYLARSGGTINGNLTVTGKLTASGLEAGVPLGTVLWMNCPRNAIPDGWVPLDGQALLKSDFPDLWNMVANGFVFVASEADWWASSYWRARFTPGDAWSFRVPDLNGVVGGSWRSPVARGDGYLGGGVIIGDAIRNITGTFDANQDDGTSGKRGAFYYTGEGFAGSNGAGSWSGLTGFDASRVVPTSDENRPVSVFGTYVIKARGGTSPIPAAGSPATLTANTFNGSQKIVGNLEVTGSISGNMVNLPMLGINQSWKNVTGARAVNTNYWNTTGRPIVIAAGSIGRDATCEIWVDGVRAHWSTDIYDTPNCKSSGSVIVPPGSYYQLKLYAYGNGNAKHFISELS